MVNALERLREFGLPKATVHANNRELSEGFYRGLGLTDIEGVLREIDKLDKIGPQAVTDLLVETCGATEAQANACLSLHKSPQKTARSSLRSSMDCAKSTTSRSTATSTPWRRRVWTPFQ